MLNIVTVIFHSCNRWCSTGTV